MRHGLVDEGTTIKTTLMFSCHWKALICTFLLTKEKIWKGTFSINSDNSQNHTENQIMPFKTTVNWLFNDVSCYLVIAFFDWKIGVFQQRVVRVYWILKLLEKYKQPLKMLSEFKLLLCRVTNKTET